MIMELFGSGKNIFRVYVELDRKMKERAIDIVRQKSKMFSRQPKKVNLLDKIINWIFPPEESVDEFILRGMIRDFDILRCAVGILVQTAEAEFQKNGIDFHFDT